MKATRSTLSLWTKFEDKQEKRTGQPNCLHNRSCMNSSGPVKEIRPHGSNSVDIASKASDQPHVFMIHIHSPFTHLAMLNTSVIFCYISCFLISFNIGFNHSFLNNPSSVNRQILDVYISRIRKVSFPGNKEPFESDKLWRLREIFEEWQPG